MEIEQNTNLVLPRGDISISGPLQLDMTAVYQIEARQHETKMVTPLTCNELATEFNRGIHILSKYISWLRYEIGKAEEQFKLAKATVTLEKAPDEAAKLKNGLKPNDDWREALVVRDPECQKWSDVQAKLEAVKVFLEGKMKSLERSYYTCYKEKEQKGRLPTQSHSGSVGQTFAEAQKNFMGAYMDAEKPTVEDDVIAALKRA